MAYSYKGNLNFGLVYIPITLHSSVQNRDISFNLLDRKTHSRIKYQKTCVDCNNKTISNADIVKGYEYESGKYVIFENEDFEKIKTPKDESIVIEQFVSLEEVDPLYFDKPYYIVPTGAKKAFVLLLAAMEKENKVGIAKTILGTKESLVLLRAKDGKMLLNTLFFNNEITDEPVYEITEKFTDKELKLAKSLIDSMTGTFHIEEYQNEYNKRLIEAIELKISGKQIQKRKTQKNLKTLNLLEALEQSLVTKKERKKLQ